MYRREVLRPKAGPGPTLSLHWETKSSFHFSHGPATRATSTGERDAEKTMQGREQGDQYGKDNPQQSPSGSELN